MIQGMLATNDARANGSRCERANCGRERVVENEEERRQGNA